MRHQLFPHLLSLFLLLAGVASTALPAAAQLSGRVRAGDKVRSRSLGIQGEVQRIDARVLVLAPGRGRTDSLVLPRAELRDLELSRSQRRNTVQGIGVGGVVLGVGLALASSAPKEKTCTEWCLESTTASEEAVYALIFGALAGSALGAVIGSQIRTDIWQPAELAATGFLLPLDAGRVAMGLRLQL